MRLPSGRTRPLARLPHRSAHISIPLRFLPSPPSSPSPFPRPRHLSSPSSSLGRSRRGDAVTRWFVLLWESVGHCLDHGRVTRNALQSYLARQNGAPRRQTDRACGPAPPPSLSLYPSPPPCAACLWCTTSIGMRPRAHHASFPARSSPFRARAQTGRPCSSRERSAASYCSGTSLGGAWLHAPRPTRAPFAHVPLFLASRSSFHPATTTPSRHGLHFFPSLPLPPSIVACTRAITTRSDHKRNPTQEWLEQRDKKHLMRRDHPEGGRRALSRGR